MKGTLEVSHKIWLKIWVSQFEAFNWMIYWITDVGKTILFLGSLVWLNLRQIWQIWYLEHFSALLCDTNMINMISRTFLYLGKFQWCDAVTLFLISYKNTIVLNYLFKKKRVYRLVNILSYKLSSHTTMWTHKLDKYIDISS